MDDSEKPKKPVKLTREELYALVWQAPMQRLADQYGITGRGLAKICERADVPYPPRGYWAKRVAGKRVHKIPLAADSQSANQVIITPTPPRVARIRPMGPEMSQRYDEALQQTSNVRVPRVLKQIHPVVGVMLAEHARWLDLSRRDRTARHLWPKLTKVDHRRHRILNALFGALEARGFKIKSENGRAPWVQSDGDRIEFALREHIRQTRQPVSDEEKRDPFYGGQRFKQIRTPTGKLVFKIASYLEDGIPVEWMDGDDALIEDRIGEIVAVFVTAAPFLAARRKAAEERERQRWEEENKRREAEARERHNQRQWNTFVELAGQWREAHTARQFLAALEGLPSPEGLSVGGRTVAKWIAWAREQLRKHDPLAYEVETIWNTVERCCTERS
jgi:hypothetical protein